MSSRGYMREIRKGVWRCKIYLGQDLKTKKKKYKTVTLRGNEREVQRQLRGLAAQARSQEGLAVSPRTPLREFLEYWLLRYGEKKLRLTTLENYRTIIRKHIAPEIGDIPLEKLSWQHLDDLYDQKGKQGLSTRTVRLIHSILHCALGWAAEKKRGILIENVAEAADPPALEQREFKPLSQEEALRLLTVAYEDRCYAAFVLAATLGMRRGEILGLTWDDVDLKAGKLNVTRNLVLVNGKIHFQHPKTKKSKAQLDFSDEVAEVLKKHRLRQVKEKMLAGEGYQDNNLVFATEIGTPVNPRNFILRHFKPALEKAELPRTVRFHDLRHTCASLMIANKEDLATISEILRHARRSTTIDIYTHPSSSAQLKANKRLASQLLEPDGRPKKTAGTQQPRL